MRRVFILFSCWGESPQQENKMNSNMKAVPGLKCWKNFKMC